MKKIDFSKSHPDCNVSISQQGLEKLQSKYNPYCPGENINWTSDINIELPIFVEKKEGPNSELPLTVPQFWHQQLKIFKDYPALSVVKNGTWKTLTYQEYYDLSVYFAIAMIKLQMNQRSSVNILGFNSIEWMVSFHGSIFANLIPAGIYNTSSNDICKYIANHSEAEIIILDTVNQLEKYLEIIQELPKVKYIVIIADYLPASFINTSFKGKILHFTEIIQIGQVNYNSLINELTQRMESCQPGSCSHLVYTSGTTGVPKAAMISHDSFTWNTKRMKSSTKFVGQPQFVSFLPLSHVATQIVEVIGTLLVGGHVWFAEAKDLGEGTLIDKWRLVRPSLIVGVPRVFEKIKDKIQLMASKEQNFFKTRLLRWVKSKGPQGTFQEQAGLKTDFSFKIAKKLVFDKVKKQMGLDRLHAIVNGAAPLSPEIRKFFLELNIFIINCFGMTETVGGHIFTDPCKYENLDDCLTSVGQCIEGAEAKIFEPDEAGVGELCLKGRNIFMGYYKDRESTIAVIDDDRFLHSQDLGKIDKLGNVSIVGRIKDLIITSGGENVAPQQLADAIKHSLPQLISQVHVIGDQRKYIVALITLNEKDAENSTSGKLSESALFFLQKNDCSAQTSEQAMEDAKVQKLIEEAVKAGNTKGASQVARVKKWRIMPREFTISSGDLTSTMKIRKQIVESKFKALIEEMYNEKTQLKQSKL